MGSTSGYPLFFTTNKLNICLRAQNDFKLVSGDANNIVKALAAGVYE